MGGAPGAVERIIKTFLMSGLIYTALDQSEASVQVTWSLSTNQRPVFLMIYTALVRILFLFLVGIVNWGRAPDD